MATESLVLWISVYVALAYNGSFLRATTTGRSWEATETWFFVGALVISLIALHGLKYPVPEHGGWPEEGASSRQPSAISRVIPIASRNTGS